ncbi:MAG: methyltransferase domain-containing protein [Beijerinckiaceae bacterium]|jgi:ubiquinone/menaquinone biosynthesis C-methylase UbiE|nr:methyltransferase domain-containing protein [Beijerinckiaceae bacterium]
MNWREFWNGEHSIYVSERHKLLHARIIERALVGLAREATSGNNKPYVLDHGCGEALHAEALAAASGKLWLCDSAPSIRAQLASRLGRLAHVEIVAPETIEIGVADDSLDLITVISVLQYLTEDELSAALSIWLRKLKPGGALVIGDVIPPDAGMVTDTRALLTFAWQGGFLMAAIAGLVRTALSDYRKLRETLGLSMHTAAQMDTRLHRAGFDRVQRRDNIGHNSARMTFIARKPA